jgi:hypothetical protein
MRFEITDDGYPIGYHVITITFYPLEYIPADSILNLYSNIYFTLHYIDNNNDILRPLMQSKLSNDISKAYLKSLVSNYEDINTVSGGALEVINTGTIVSNLKSMTPSTFIDLPDYIIITCDSLKNGFQRLADWKTQKGIYTMVTTVEDIYSMYQGYDNAEKIRNYLKDVYVNFGCSFVLMGGDVGIVPVRFSMINVGFNTGIYETDFYYATVQGNWNANGNDVFGESNDSFDQSPVFYVGRAPVHNNHEVNVFVNKVIGYEKLNNTPNKNYIQNLAFWVADLKPENKEFFKSTTDSIESNTKIYFDQSKLNILKLYDHYNDSTFNYKDSMYLDRYFELNRLNVVEAMNQGWYNFNHDYGRIHVIYHADHSGFDAMGTSSLIYKEHVFISDMHDLLNGLGYSQILYSDGCQTSQFSKDAIPEEYLNNSNGGGVAFLGNSADGLSSETGYFIDFCKELYDTTKNDVYNNIHYYLGNLHRASTFNGSADRLKKRILLGDPSMMVWSATPTNLTVSNVAYSASNKTITGTVSGLLFNTASHVIVTVCAWKGSEIYVVKEIDATTASVNFVLSDVVADTPGDIIVTVTAYNYIPNIDTLHVLSINGAHPYMSYDDNMIIDDFPLGNNSGTADAGETVELYIQLTNSGNSSAVNVTAALSWQPSTYQAMDMISISSSSANFNNISVGGTSINNFVFTIHLDAFENIVPHPVYQNVIFTLDIYINNVFYSTEILNIPIYESHLIKRENILTGTLTSGSSNQLKIKLFNTGLAEAVGTSGLLSATLTTNNPENITVTTGTDTYNTINGANVQQNYGLNIGTFEFIVGDQDYSNETFNLSVTDKYGKTWTFDHFNLSKPSNLYTNISHHGYDNSICLSFPFYYYSDIICEGCYAQGNGYNLYRSTNVNGPYIRINENIIPYSTYLDENLEPSTIYYYKVTFINHNGNESLFFPETGYLASTVLNTHTGWPVLPYPSINIIGNASKGSPNVYDVDGDNNKEIFFTTGSMGNPEGGVWAFKQDGTRWYMLDNTAGSVSGFIDLNCYTSSTPAIADIDNDGIAEIGITTHPINGSFNSQQLLVYKTTVDNNNDNLPDKHFNNKSISGWEVNKGAVFADIDNNENYEILINNQHDNNLLGINIFNQNGNIHTGWLNSSQQDFGLCGFSMPVAFDFDNDGKKEIVIGCTGYESRKPGIYIYKEDGTNFGQNNPVYLPQDITFRYDMPPIVADIDNDGTYEIMFICAKAITAHIYAMKPDGSPVSGWDWNNVNHPSFTLRTSVGSGGSNSYLSQFCPNFSVGDLDKDGFLEVVCGDKGHLYVWNHTGGNTPIKDIYIPNYTSDKDKVPILADIDEDEGDLEIIITNKFTSPTEGTDIFAYKMDGTLAKGFPITIDALVNNSPCIDDIDNDGMNELIVSTGMEFYVWDSYGNANNNVYGWKSYRRDNLNSGVFYNETCNYSSTAMNINSNKEWEKFQIINENVVINSGASLKITSEIRFNKNATITVKPGGKLIIDGGTLTNACNGELWRGIEVRGNPLLSQDLNNTNQGILILQNGAIIENAECGVFVGEKNTISVSINGGTIISIPEGFEEPISMSSSGGGIVSATNSSFINNKKAINFQDYIDLSNNMEIDNKSSFINCSFIVKDDALFIVADNESQVSLQNVKGVRFNGCVFEDAQSKSSLDNYGIGIYSYNAGICLNDNRSPFNSIPYVTTPCSFTGYGTAILLKNSGTRPVRIYNTLFANNRTSINALSSYALTMQMCNVYNSQYGYFPSLYGLVLNKCDNYSVANNIFHGDGTGILFLGVVPNNNYIKNNTFHDICVACYVEEKQGLDNFCLPSIGLKFSCNLFNNNDEDIKVAENGFISSYQGYYSALYYKYYGIGNQFGNPNISTMNIDNCNNNFEIWYYYDLNGYNHKPVNCNNINPPNPNILIDSVPGNKCFASGYVGENYYLTITVFPISELNDMYLDVINEYNSLKTEYINIYGSTNIVDIVHSQGLPNIHGLNPQFDMYAELTDLKDSLTIICQNALQLLLTSEELDKSEYNTWLYRCQTIDAEYVLAESYLNEGNITQMNTVLDSILIKYPNCDLVENAQYNICLNYLYQWTSVDIDSLVITQEAIDTLELIASGFNRASLKAESMLERLGKDIVPRWEPDRCNWWVIGNAPSENKNETSIKETKISLKQEMILMPNPATDELTVDNGQIYMKEMYVYDVVGKEVKHLKSSNTKITVSVGDLCPGVYMVKVLSEDGIAMKKFVKE